MTDNILTGHPMTEQEIERSSLIQRGDDVAQDVVFVELPEVSEQSR